MLPVMTMLKTMDFWSECSLDFLMICIPEILQVKGFNDKNTDKSRAGLYKHKNNLLYISSG